MVEDWRADVRLGVDSSTFTARPARHPDEPLVIAVLGDFSGQPLPGDHRSLQSVAVDLDNFDQVLERCQVGWRGALQLGSTQAAVPVEITLRALEDFHPDRLLRLVPALATLLDTRNALLDPRRFERPSSPLAVERQQSLVERSTASVTSSLLDQVVAQSSGASAQASSPLDDLQSFVAAIVAGHATSVDRRAQAEHLAAVDHVLASDLRAIVHQAQFQALEANWRGLDRLVRAVGSDDRVKVEMVSLAREQLAEALRGEPDECALGRLWSDPRKRPPAAIAVAYCFAEEPELLRHMARVAQFVGAPMIAGAAPSLLGLASFAELPHARELAARFASLSAEWTALRQSPQASWLCLALPGFLGRLPYGASTDPIESFEWEELADNDRHQSLLWLPAAFALAEVIARRFMADGWQMDLATTVQRIGRLPLYVYRADGESLTQPGAEVAMTDSQVQELARAGLTPLVSMHDQDEALLPCVQTLAEPRRPLAF